MADEDRQRWNDRYRAGEHSSSTPSQLVTNLESYLPRQGAAIDVAGGTGRNGLWLARRGLEVTLADISDVALEVALQRAAADGLNLTPLRIDLEKEPFPLGPWDFVLVMHFLSRSMLAQIPAALAAGGTLVVIQPTISNLERHPKPPAPYLLADGELPALVGELEILHYEEGWLAEDRHEAVLVARKPKTRFS